MDVVDFNACDLFLSDCGQVFGCENGKSRRKSKCVLPNQQITSETAAGFETKSTSMFVQTILKMEYSADNGIWNWSMAAATIAAMWICQHVGTVRGMQMVQLCLT